MSASLDETIETIVRRVIREELEANYGGDRLLTPEQVAETLGFNDVESIYRLKREGKLKPVYLGERTLRFKNSVVQQFIKDAA